MEISSIIVIILVLVLVVAAFIYEVRRGFELE